MNGIKQSKENIAEQQYDKHNLLKKTNKKDFKIKSNRCSKESKKKIEAHTEMI